MKVRYAGSTHVGRKRTHNEDNFFLLAEENLYIVADGMGGHASGEVASQIAVETLANFFLDTSRDREITWPYKESRAATYEENRLITGIKLANRRVFEAAQAEATMRGMGTTLVSMLSCAAGTYLGHVGDSRGYRIRGDAITQVTEDHSLLNDYLKLHPLTDHEIANFPHKNVIVRALGMKEVVAVDISRVVPEPGDLFLLCSDGLSGMVDDASILACAREHRQSLESLCEALIAEANASGGQDNITVVVVEFLD